jgi:hypothetical protein
MMVKRFIIFTLVIVVLSVVSFRQYLVYVDNREFSTMSVWSFEKAEKENSLVAIYTDNKSDTIYLQKVLIHNGNHQYYSKEFYAEHKSPRPEDIRGLKYNDKYLTQYGFDNRLSGIDVIRDTMYCVHFNNLIPDTFFLKNEFQENINLGSRKSYVKELYKVFFE